MSREYAFICPKWVSGKATRFLPMNLLIVILVVPFLFCIGIIMTGNTLRLISAQEWYAPTFEIAGALGILALLIGTTTLTYQHQLSIQLNNEFHIITHLVFSQRYQTWNRRTVSRYQRLVWDSTYTLRLERTLIFGISLLVVGFFLGICFVGIELWSIQFGVGENEVANFLRQTLLDCTLVVFMTSPVLILGWMYWRLKNSDGRIQIWFERGSKPFPLGSSAKPDLTVFASLDDLKKLESWLKGTGNSESIV